MKTDKPPYDLEHYFNPEFAKACDELEAAIMNTVNPILEKIAYWLLQFIE